MSLQRHFLMQTILQSSLKASLHFTHTSINFCIFASGVALLSYHTFQSRRSTTQRSCPQDGNYIQAHLFQSPLVHHCFKFLVFVLMIGLRDGVLVLVGQCAGTSVMVTMARCNDCGSVIANGQGATLKFCPSSHLYF